MSSSKIEFTFGALTFSGEGEQEWLSKQLDKVIAAAPKLSELKPPPVASAEGQGAGAHQPSAGGPFTATLASYIKTKGGDSVQTQRFLATADWLRQRGTAQLTSAAVTKALSDNHQKKLGNASDCLNQNVTKGFCEKTTDGGFYITPDGLKHLGHTA